MADDDIDLWGEDEILNSITNHGRNQSYILNREWKWRHGQFHTMGYRNGISAGKEASAQKGFNVGFKQSVLIGHKWGLVRGISSAYINLPDDLKEKLAARTEKRVRLQNLHQSAQMISTTDALKMFHESIRHSETSKEPSERNSQLPTNSEEVSGCNMLDSLFEELMLVLHDSPEIDVKL